MHSPAATLSLKFLWDTASISPFHDHVLSQDMRDYYTIFALWSSHLSRITLASATYKPFNQPSTLAFHFSYRPSNQPSVFPSLQLSNLLSSLYSPSSKKPSDWPSKQNYVAPSSKKPSPISPLSRISLSKKWNWKGLSKTTSSGCCTHVCDLLI
jgi:hypothetical protein